MSAANPASETNLPRVQFLLANRPDPESATLKALAAWASSMQVALGGSPVNRFSDRPAACRRFDALCKTARIRLADSAGVESIDMPEAPEPSPAEDSSAAPEPIAAAVEAEVEEIDVPEVAAAQPAKHNSSWANPQVRAARTRRNGCCVVRPEDGVACVYKSVHAASDALLQLPVHKAQQLRLDVKAAAVFELDRSAWVALGELPGRDAVVITPDDAAARALLFHGVDRKTQLIAASIDGAMTIASALTGDGDLDKIDEKAVEHALDAGAATFSGTRGSVTMELLWRDTDAY